MIILISSMIIAASVIIAGLVIHDAVIKLHNAYVQIAEWQAKRENERPKR